METKIMTKSELINRVSDFLNEIEPTIKALTDETTDEQIKPGLVLSLVLPHDDDNDRHQGLVGIQGTGNGIIQAVANLDKDDTNNLIYMYLEKKRQRLARKAEKELRDLIKEIDEFRKAKYGDADAEPTNEDE